MVELNRCNALTLKRFNAAMDLATIRASFPSEGLFAEKDFLLSPDPFPVDDKFAKELEQLGHRLYVFQRACNELYQRSAKGKQPAWIAQYLDAGKPASRYCATTCRSLSGPISS